MSRGLHDNSLYAVEIVLYLGIHRKEVLKVEAFPTLSAYVFNVQSQVSFIILNGLASDIFLAMGN